MAFVPRDDWKNLPDTSTPIKAEDMIRIEAGIAAAHDAVEALPAPLTLGTTAGTALAGNTALLKLGTTATTALKGDTPLLKVGTTATDAKAGDYQPTYASLPDKPTIPAAPAAGTAAQLTAGTDTVQRTWSAKMIADEVARQIAAIEPSGG